ncbi:hypothetical protein ACQZ45_25600 [Agrobacterium sp. 16-2014-1-2a]|uniref:SIR2-like domain-containing protein n=1 Tax=Agrobacterium tumefaciens TaxID=358 RepID=A0AB36ED44_AGRTU|nr:hypothetical protein A6U91_18555 [Agrobacterium tumefaciens]
MFRDKTTFVVGAGASVEFGLPIGAGLATRIKKSSVLHIDNYRSKISYGDEFFMHTVKRIWPTDIDRKPVLEALSAIHNGIRTAVSIDAFVHRNNSHSYIPKLGKMLIALEILKAERESTMLNEVTEQMRKRGAMEPDFSWLGQFVRIMLDGVTNVNEVGKNIKIICFNYDRCIEYYLRQSIVDAFRVSIEEAHAIVSRMEIIHPYGWLGELPLNNTSVGDRIAFGSSEEHISLEEIAERNIRTYTEQFEDAKMIQRIHRAMAHCSVLAFLGFGFNNQNLDLLRVKYIPELPARNVYATGYNLSKVIDGTMKRRIRHLFVEDDEQWRREDWDAKIRVGYSQTCSELFDTHTLDFTRYVQNQIRCFDDVPRLEPVRSKDRSYDG